MSNLQKKDNFHLFVCYPVKQNKTIEGFQNPCLCGKGIFWGCKTCTSVQENITKVTTPEEKNIQPMKTPSVKQNETSPNVTPRETIETDYQKILDQLMK